MCLFQGVCCLQQRQVRSMAISVLQPAAEIHIHRSGVLQPAAPTLAVTDMHVFFYGPEKIANELNIDNQEGGVIIEVKDNKQV